MYILLLYKNLSYKKIRLKNAQNLIKNMLRIYPRLRKGEELIVWMLHKIVEIICFSANIHHCILAFSGVHV